MNIYTHIFTYFLKDPIPDSLLPARLKHHEKTEESPDSNDSGIPASTGNGRTAANLSRTWYSKEIGTNWVSATSSEHLKTH